jgi:hypothetical protein
LVDEKYVEFSEKFYCKVHNTVFSKDKRCPLCTLSPKFPVENDNSKKVLSNNSTSNSQAITSNSQGVPKRRYVRKVKDSIFERFHNFGVKFEAEVDWSALFSEVEVRLNNSVSYKRLDFPEAIVKVFRRSILVSLRSSMELKGLPVREAESRSKALVRSVVSRLPRSIVVKGFDVVNVHNAFVNHPLAKFPLRVEVDGTTRLISDHSKGFGEFEAVSPVDAVSDSVLIEDDIKGLIKNGLSRDFLASAIHKLVEDREYYADNLKSHVSAIQELSKGISLFSARLDGKVSPPDVFSSCGISPFPSRSENGAGVHCPVPNVSAGSSPAQINLLRWF